MQCIELDPAIDPLLNQKEILEREFFSGEGESGLKEADQTWA